MFARIYTFLSKINPLIVLVAYLAMIPIFAAMFCSLPGRNFYAPYAHMEPPALDDAAKVRKNISDAMFKSYAGHQSSAEGWQIAPSDIQAEDLDTGSANSLSFTVHYFAAKYDKGEIVASTGGPQFTAQLSQLKIVTSSRPGWMVCHLVSPPPESTSEVPAVFNRHLLFRSPVLALQADSICWGGNEEVALQNLLAGWSGDPKALSGIWLRMVYYSATTITTVGFGDIVPLTTLARMLTAMEAITGWVLAGLFLNSLATRIAGDQSTAP